MEYLADLHTHTTASDGQHTPAELVRLAKGRGIQVLAATDHDTIAGVDEAMSAGETWGLRVIRGVELSAKEHHNFHILGYGFRDGDTELAQLCEKLRAGRDERKYKIIDFLREKGVSIDLAEVEELAGGEVIARPHFAQVLVKRGYVSTNREAFDRYLDTEEFRKRVKRFKADARTCVEAIKSAGGKVSLAHPYQMGLPDEELEALVGQLKDCGLDAIECYYPKYTAEQQALYLHLAEKYRLHPRATPHKDNNQYNCLERCKRATTANDRLSPPSCVKGDLRKNKSGFLFWGNCAIIRVCSATLNRKGCKQ